MFIEISALNRSRILLTLQVVHCIFNKSMAYVKTTFSHRAGNTTKRVEFSNAILPDMENNNFLPRLIFSNEATFHINGKVNRHNPHI